jgi:hypothetical protein
LGSRGATNARSEYFSLMKLNLTVRGEEGCGFRSAGILQKRRRKEKKKKEEERRKGRSVITKRYKKRRRKTDCGFPNGVCHLIPEGLLHLNELRGPRDSVEVDGSNLGYVGSQASMNSRTFYKEGFFFFFFFL